MVKRVPTQPVWRPDSGASYRGAVFVRRRLCANRQRAGGNLRRRNDQQAAGMVERTRPGRGAKVSCRVMEMVPGDCGCRVFTLSLGSHLWMAPDGIPRPNNGKQRPAGDWPGRAGRSDIPDPGWIFLRYPEAGLGDLKNDAPAKHASRARPAADLPGRPTPGPPIRSASSRSTCRTRLGISLHCEANFYDLRDIAFLLLTKKVSRLHHPY